MYNLTDLEIIMKANEIFDSEIKKLRPADEGKYLMLYVTEPWAEWKFLIGAQKDYQDWEINKNKTEILLGSEYNG